MGGMGGPSLSLAPEQQDPKQSGHSGQGGGVAGSTTSAKTGAKTGASTRNSDAATAAANTMQALPMASQVPRLALLPVPVRPVKQLVDADRLYARRSTGGGSDTPGGGGRGGDGGNGSAGDGLQRGARDRRAGGGAAGAGGAGSSETNQKPAASKGGYGFGNFFSSASTLLRGSKGGEGKG